MYPEEVPEAVFVGEGGTNNSFCDIGTMRISRTNYEDSLEYLYQYKYECWH